MSRSGYTDDCDDQWAHIRWRGAVKSAMRGKNGQAFLREMLATLEAMPDKRLLAVTINKPEGCCAIGAVTRARGIDTTDIDQLDPDYDYDGESARLLAKRVGIAEAMAMEIVDRNDSGFGIWEGSSFRKETPEERWTRMRDWVKGKIIETTPNNATRGMGDG